MTRKETLKNKIVMIGSGKSAPFYSLTEKMFPDYAHTETVMQLTSDQATYTVQEDAYYIIYISGKEKTATSISVVSIDKCEVLSMLCNPLFNRSTGFFVIKKGSIITCTSETTGTSAFIIKKVPFCK